MKTIYCVSGLGADQRAFQNLMIPGFKLSFIKWLSPEKDESMNHYAFRLLAQIADDRPILLGLSFGGMIAIEMSKLINTEMVILLSSAKNKGELNPHFEKIIRWNLIKMIPETVITSKQFSIGICLWSKAKMG